MHVLGRTSLHVFGHKGILHSRMSLDTKIYFVKQMYNGLVIVATALCQVPHVAAPS